MFAESNVIDIYDTLTREWPTAALSVPKFSLSAVTAGNKIFFAGGYDWAHWNDPFKSIDIYDSSNASSHWSTASLKAISGAISGVALHDNIYWGGVDWSQNLGKAEIWNRESGTVSVTCLSYPRRFPTTVARNQDVVFFTPGDRLFTDVFTNKFDIYNSITGTWTIGLLNQPIAAAGLISVNNTVYMAGGLTNTNSVTNKVYVLSW